MTDKNILEGNKLIAEFMGDTFHTDIEIGSDLVDKAWLCNLDQKYYSSLFYHKSWNWLIPVTKKVCNTIEKLLDSIKESINESYEEDLMNFYSAFVEVNFFEIAIEDIYMQCVSFINWYNDNK